VSDDTLETRLRGEGTVESEGGFTIDYRAARERLRDHLLPGPEMYMLKFLQSAVAAGASKLTVRRERGILAATHDGCQPEVAALPRLLEHLLGEEQGHVRLLAAAVNAVVEKSEVTLTSWNAEHTAAVRMSREGVHVLASVVPPVFQLWGVQLAVPCTAAPWRSPPELGLLRKLAVHAPILLTIDGSAVGGALPCRPKPEVPHFVDVFHHLTAFLPDGRYQYYNSRHNALELRFRGNPEQGMVGMTDASGASAVWQGPWDGDVGSETCSTPWPGWTYPSGDRRGPRASAGREVRAWRAVLALQVDLQRPSSVAVVVGGVIVGRLDPALLPSGVVGAVGVPLEAADLSGLQVREAAVSQIAADVRPRAERLYQLLGRSAPEGSADDAMASLLTRVPGSHLERRGINAIHLGQGS
jgi:hypothetical protein